MHDMKSITAHGHDKAFRPKKTLFFRCSIPFNQCSCLMEPPRRSFEPGVLWLRSQAEPCLLCLHKDQTIWPITFSKYMSPLRTVIINTLVAIFAMNQSCYIASSFADGDIGSCS